MGQSHFVKKSHYPNLSNKFFWLGISVNTRSPLYQKSSLPFLVSRLKSWSDWFFTITNSLDLLSEFRTKTTTHKYLLRLGSQKKGKHFKHDTFSLIYIYVLQTGLITKYDNFFTISNLFQTLFWKKLEILQLFHFYYFRLRDFVYVAMFRWWQNFKLG